MTKRNRYPRSLTEAFGPYANGPIEEPKRRMDWQDRVVLAGCVLTALAALFLVVWG